MKLNDAFESKYMSVSDLDGENLIVTIKSIEMETLKGRDGKPDDEKPVLFFKGLQKGMVVNKTNWKAITKATNEEDSDDWIGKSIELYEGEATTFSGDVVAALRVKAKPPKASKPAPAKRVDDDDEEPEERPAAKRKVAREDDDQIPF